MEINIIITRELCSGCGNCIVVCPRNSLASLEIASGKGGEAEMLGCENGEARSRDSSCNGCGLCSAVCPTGALSTLSLDGVVENFRVEFAVADASILRKQFLK